ncbi:hypothetical protein [Paractinoplanes rishiriensis]|uniref:Uncharacterized protein n=1 Tax=Paractinoplanes rishiriensis TaxID=1050105 RepID=A0A919JUR5_9ACTN|nr:hypothetical protein [Actinoplanes rishiriensis]GIE95581.1 hypothetical protein Ari01nite_30460 [Actinoplanes rishiriensis]
MPYEWDDWALAALAGIAPHEVRQALAAHRRWPRRAVSATGVPVLTVWSRTTAGRPLIVAVYQVAGTTWRIIGARDMTDKELIEFSHWEATR